MYHVQPFIVYLINYKATTDKLYYFYTYWDKHSTLIYLLSNQLEFILKNVFKKRLSNNDIYI